jgi:hypothetical protein
MSRYQPSPRRNYSHDIANRLSDTEWKSLQGASALQLSVKLDLRPLAKALADLGPETFKRNEAIRRAINRGLDKFNSAAHKHLKALTKIRQPTRLKKGVSIRRARFVGNGIEGSYIIVDRNIRITRAYFGAHYVRSGSYGRPGGRARWGKPFSPAGATWTSWDGQRTGRKTFMIEGSKPVFIRLRKMGKGRDAITPVWGPNPAEMIQLNLPLFERVLVESSQAELERQIKLAYDKGVQTVKRRYGL